MKPGAPGVRTLAALNGSGVAGRGRWGAWRQPGNERPGPHRRRPPQKPGSAPKPRCGLEPPGGQTGPGRQGAAVTGQEPAKKQKAGSRRRGGRGLRSTGGFNLGWNGRSARLPHTTDWITLTRLGPFHPLVVRRCGCFSWTAHAGSQPSTSIGTWQARQRKKRRRNRTRRVLSKPLRQRVQGSLPLHHSRQLQGGQ